MPLASLLDRLGGLISKYFLVGQFFPALIFGFVNAAILYAYSPAFRKWSEKLTSSTPSIFASIVTLIAISVAGYLLSCVNTFLRQVLEGKYIPDRLCAWRLSLETLQLRKYQKIQDGYRNARIEGSRIEDEKPVWTEKLTAAAILGKNTNVNTYDENAPAAKRMTELRMARQQAKTIPFESLESAFRLLEIALTANSVALPATGPKLLVEHRHEFLVLIDYARDAWAAHEIEQFNAGTRFGVGSIAPTAMGNIAAGMQGYGITRYRLNLDTFWTRLQPVLAAANKDFYQGLLDSRTQLDFLIACCWLTALSTIVWLPFLPFGDTWWLFPAVALVGPAASWLFYRLAVENYVVFTELVRAAVDLYRFQLLQQLHIALPNGIREERARWDALQRLSTYGQETVNVSYQHDPKGGAS